MADPKKPQPKKAAPEQSKPVAAKGKKVVKPQSKTIRAGEKPVNPTQ